ncbi:MAG TPA: DinB family protein [Blastocatellia bacterium]|nr:DinB family protein [Blastocatellia bacterium]
MKRLLGAILGTVVVMAGGAGSKGQNLSQPDMDRGLQYLESTKKNIVDATRGLSEAQWNFKPSVFKWSVAQVIEHIAASEDLLRQMAENQIKQAPPGAGPDRDLKKTDDRVLEVIPDRSRKFQAPEQLRPRNQFGSPEAALKHFLESRAKTVELLKTTPDLRAHVVDSGLLGKVDAFERILFVAAHSERHTKQLLEVKADPKFPKQ